MIFFGIKSFVLFIMALTVFLSPVDLGTAESIRLISNLEKAELVTPGGTYTLTDENDLKWIEENFSIAEPFEGSGCPFDATLTLFSKDGSVITLYIATDSCHTFRTEDGSYFYYGNEEEAFRKDGGTYSISETFWGLFGLTPSYEDIYLGHAMDSCQPDIQIES